MVNLFTTPLGAGLVLMLAALALTFVRRRLRPFAPRTFALVSVAGAAGLFLWLVLSGRPAEFARAWDPVALPGGSWLWQIDGWSWLAGSVLFLLGATSLLVGWEETGEGNAPTLSATLLLLAASSLFVFAGNLLSLAASWVVLDVAVGLRAASEGPEAGARAWGLCSLGTLLLLAALLFAGPAGAYQPLSEETAPLSIIALFLAALLRSGAFPFHIWQMPHRQHSRSGLMAIHLVAPLSGLWLLGQLLALSGPYFRSQPAWASLGVLGMLGSGLAAYLAKDAIPRTAWVAVNRVSLAVLAASLAPEPGTSALIWPLLTLSLGVGILVVGQTILGKWGWRQPMALAVLTLVGLPGTPGFFARLPLIDLSALSIAYSPLWLLALLAEVLFVAALLAWLFRSRGPRTQPVTAGSATRLLTAGVLLAVPLLVFGLQPPFLAGFSGLDEGASGFRPLLTQLQELSSSGWAVLLVPWVGGGLLAWRREHLLSGLGAWRDMATRVVGLEWGYGGLRWAVEGAIGLVRGLGTLVEGEGYFGWLALAAILGWMLWNQ